MALNSYFDRVLQRDIIATSGLLLSQPEALRCWVEQGAGVVVSERSRYQGSKATGAAGLLAMATCCFALHPPLSKLWTTR